MSVGVWCEREGDVGTIKASGVFGDSVHPFRLFLGVLGIDGHS